MYLQYFPLNMFLTLSIFLCSKSVLISAIFSDMPSTDALQLSNELGMATLYMESH